MPGTNRMSTPRPEYPRPQFVRSSWLCLNGEWEFEVDSTRRIDLETLSARQLSSSIVVPFAPESVLSGVNEQSFMDTVWYRRVISIPGDWKYKRLLLHFQAVDHDAMVWVNGVMVGRHRGGFTPFSFDISDAVGGGNEFVLLVRAKDGRDAVQARGKQSKRAANYETFYTRTTGIWQTVWIEPLAESYLLRTRITPNVESRSFVIEAPVSHPIKGAHVDVRIADDHGQIVHATAVVGEGFLPTLTLVLPEDRVRLWEPADPFLYSITLELRLGEVVVDRVESYGGMRSISIDGKRILLNGRPVFQRLVLDQGYYPDGLMTAPSDSALIADIQAGLDAGFNGARLHQKVFEERFLYHADRLGYLVWGEFGDWGANLDDKVGRQEPTASFITQWIEALERDYSHPSIVGWCPLNETFQPITDEITTLDDVTRGLYLATKAIDQTRPVIDASGYSHRVDNADVYDSHNYEQDPAKFKEAMDGLKRGSPYVNTAVDGTTWSVPYAGQPYFCSEFGGIWWSDLELSSEQSWGYGAAPAHRDEWWSRFEGLVGALLDNPDMFGYCYTQLTDVFQEKNGLFTFDRLPKFDLNRLRAIQIRPASIEKLSGTAELQPQSSPDDVRRDQRQTTLP
jgi:beta-galactosidase/beta-glucuronidase